MSLVSDGWTFASGGPPYGGTSYVEYVESGRLSTSWDNSSITRVYQVDDSSLGNFLQSLLGYSTYVDEGNQDFSLIRNIPEEDREFPGYFASEVNVERLGQGTLASTGLAPPKDRLSSWNVARITCQFKPAPFSYPLDNFTGTELDRYVTRKYTVVADYLSLTGLMQFVSRPAPPNPNPANVPAKVIDNPPGMQIGWLEKEITHHQVPARQVVGHDAYSPFVPPNLNTVTVLLGCTNYKSFDGDAPGTLLFTGYTYKLVMPKLGSLASARQYYYDLTYRFKRQDQGAGSGLVGAQPADANGQVHAGVNYIFDVIYKRWDLITSDGTLTGSQIYSDQTSVQYYDATGHLGNNVDFNALIPNANTTFNW